MAGKFVLKTASDGQYHFTLKSSNGEVILSSERYKIKPSALNGIASVQKNGGEASRFRKLVAANGKAYFTLTAANHQVIGTGEMYESEKARDKGIAAVMKTAPKAKTEEVADAPPAAAAVSA